MRVSDFERQRVIDELRRHCAAGRLDVDEYADRIERVLSATTLEELDRILGDLPMLRIADPAGSLPVSAAAENGSGGSRSTTSRLPSRLGATAVVLLTVAVVLSVVLLAALASWTWGVVLLVGWLIGMVQSRLLRRRN